METLVLDIGYQPVARVSWERAFTLFFLGKVEIVEEYEDAVVRSATLEWKVPAVVRFLQFCGVKNKSAKFSRENVYARDKGKCQYCKCNVKRSEITYDHVVPKSLGGKTNWENIATCCFDCNQCKKDRQTSCANKKCKKCLGKKYDMNPIQKPVKPKFIPASLKFTFFWRKGMPKEWKSYLVDIMYWHTRLDED